MAFNDWLLIQIRKSGLSQSEIARRGGISHARISQVLAGETPGEKFCKGIAQGLNIPADIVFREAGKLPQRKDDDLALREVYEIVRALNSENREQITRIASLMLREQRESS